MAKKIYVGVNNIARNVPKAYVGVGGVARKIIKGYVGDANGVARLFFDGSGGGAVGAWLYFTPLTTPFAWTENGNLSYAKSNIGIAYFGIAICHTPSGDAYTPILVSPDPNAVEYDDSSGGHGTSQGTVNHGTKVWYWSGFTTLVTGSLNPYPTGYTPDCLISNTEYSSLSPTPAQMIVDRIYDNCFSRDYKTGNWSYDLNNELEDIEASVRRAIGIFLYQNLANLSLGSYQDLNNNYETIVSNIMAQSSGFAKVTIQGLCDYSAIATGNIYFEVRAVFSNYSMGSVQFGSKITQYGYDYYNVSYGFPTSGTAYRQWFLGDGQLRSQTTTLGHPQTIGVKVGGSGIGSCNNVVAGNIGMDFSK